MSCPYCGDAITSDNNGRPRIRCAKPDCLKKLKADVTRQWHADYRERTGHTYKEPSREDGNHHAACYEHVCVVCGKQFKSHKPTQAHCSPECYRLAQAEKQRQKRLPILHPGPYSWLPANHPAMLMQQRQVKRLFIAAVCARCGKPFIVHRVGHATYCSPSCLHQASKDRRRAVKRGVGRVDYRRIDIFERDGWRCHIAGCGRKTRRDVHWSHPLAPTIDHLIPLSKGGRDAPDNVACAHRQCNSIKSDTGGAQLRLVG